MKTTSTAIVLAAIMAVVATSAADARGGGGGKGFKSGGVRIHVDGGGHRFHNHRRFGGYGLYAPSCVWDYYRTSRGVRYLCL